jgi:hypothetical protein
LMGSWVVSILDVVSGAVMTMGGQMSLWPNASFPWYVYPVVG